MMETWQKLWKVTAGLCTHIHEGGNLVYVIAQKLAYLLSRDLEVISDWISCRYLGFKRTIQLDRKRLVELLDMHQNRTLAWNEFVVAVGLAHKKRMGQPTSRKVVVDKPKEEDYFYANPQECLCEGTN